MFNSALSSWSVMWQWLWPAPYLYGDESSILTALPINAEKPRDKNHEMDELGPDEVQIPSVHERYLAVLQHLSQHLEALVTLPLSAKSPSAIALPLDAESPSAIAPPLGVESPSAIALPQLPLHPLQSFEGHKSAIQNRGRYRNIVRLWDRKAGQHRDEEVAEIVEQKPRSKNIAFTFRRIHPERLGDVVESQLDIEDPDLIQLLHSIIHPYPGINFSGDLLVMRQPFTPIVHNWDQLQDRAKQDSQSQLTKDLVHLLRRVELAPELENYFKTRDINARAKITTWEYLWTEFKPGTKVVAAPFLGEPQILQVSTSPLQTPAPFYGMAARVRPNVRSTEVRMVVWCWDWNGKTMTKSYYQTVFTYFVGTKLITELPIYPVKYHPDPSGLYDTLQERNKRYLNATLYNHGGTGRLFDYEGVAYECKRSVVSDDDSSDLPSPSPIGDAGSNKAKLAFIQGQIIVDAEKFIDTHGYQPLSDWDLMFSRSTEEEERQWKKLFTHSGANKENGLEDPSLLLPPRFLGYATKEKVWGQFRVSVAADPIQKSRKKFEEDLQLNPESKQLIWALVAAHQERQGAQIEDVVHNKGKGLVLLLHGGPGVGKTLTAETIAEATGRPLYVVSVAEVGLNATNAERNLLAHFDLATRWKAILLMDEADVFLETRDATSTETRNALVSVLLRVLEYYKGILILTTNRVKAIDIAVISRIHLAVHYSDLNEEQVHRIFKYFLDRIDKASISDRAAIDSFIEIMGSSYRFNGRQIRNVVAGALAAAQNELESKKLGADGRLTQKHLKLLCEMTRTFQEQLREYTTMQRVNREAK
ncbi:P-loop containing nucleoside triphosphate hydrolase protein [Thozetella sp. PMI_491]|nr:P-loop containing nucleoside triphosphate hydrolase protein [Thozetella sp. PMI_491]